ncbi:hypothetical protein A0H76_3021 [Hepatospora eriocheir]|uniref:Uncharacterized protein n=1 Tax=Hepatospora eriocheir TaxID=1081669 RepID=A0A1X0QIG1_9MICR|nr:hypothetical protein A0H76_3021 [Hepatospora eriocheir]
MLVLFPVLTLIPLQSTLAAPCLPVFDLVIVPTFINVKFSLSKFVKNSSFGFNSVPEIFFKLTIKFKGI